MTARLKLRFEIVEAALYDKHRKAYVAAGMGVAVVPKLAVDLSKDVDICIITSDHIFPASMAMISLRSDHLLRTFGYDFIKMIAPRWTRKAISDLSLPYSFRPDVLVISCWRSLSRTKWQVRQPGHAGAKMR